MSRLAEFVADIVKSGLMSRDELDAACSRLPPGPESESHARLARVLIGQGSLTAYQANKLLAGATKGFFLGGYRILRRLGQGGMGKVFLAVHEKTGERVALKVLPPKKALQEEQALARFRRETDLSQRVNHPNIARTIQVGEEDGVHYMALEYVPGDSLYNIVRSRHGGPLRVPDAARFFLKAIDGLNAAHAIGLVHRDIKPSNLMVTPDGDAKVLDLGLAKALGEESPLTRTNVVLGTLDYASPEQLSDAAKADRRSDLYSLGCTLYFALSGRPPFPGGDVINKIFKQRMEDPKPLEKVAAEVPSAFAAIVRKLMAKDPADRYQTGEEVQADLRRWTDPKLLPAILGAESASARDFRPPPPQLSDEDLRVFDDVPRRGSSANILRDLGDSEARPAPLHKPPLPPRPALVLPEDDFEDDLPPLPKFEPEDDRWLIRIIAVVCVLGAVAVLLLALFR